MPLRSCSQGAVVFGVKTSEAFKSLPRFDAVGWNTNVLVNTPLTLLKPTFRRCQTVLQNQSGVQSPSCCRFRFKRLQISVYPPSRKVFLNAPRCILPLVVLWNSGLETGITYSGFTPNERATWLWIRATTFLSIGINKPWDRFDRAIVDKTAGSGTKNMRTASVPAESE